MFLPTFISFVLAVAVSFMIAVKRTDNNPEKENE